MGENHVDAMFKLYKRQFDHSLILGSENVRSAGENIYHRFSIQIFYNAPIDEIDSIRGTHL